MDSFCESVPDQNLIGIFGGMENEKGGGLDLFFHGKLKKKLDIIKWFIFCVWESSFWK